MSNEQLQRERGFAKGWNACRAAMLAAANKAMEGNDDA